MKGVLEDPVELSGGDRTGNGGATAGEGEQRSDSPPTGAAPGTAAAKRILGAKLRRDPKIQAILEHLTSGQPLGEGPLPWLQAQGVDPQLVAEVDSHLRRGGSKPERKGRSRSQRRRSCARTGASSRRLRHTRP